MPKATFAKKLTDLLKQDGRLQKDIAEEMSISTSTLSKWKSGRQPPLLKEAKLLADFFDVPIEYLANPEYPAGDDGIKRAKARTSDIVLTAVEFAILTAVRASGKGTDILARIVGEDLATGAAKARSTWTARLEETDGTG